MDLGEADAAGQRVTAAERVQAHQVEGLLFVETAPVAEQVGLHRRGVVGYRCHSG